MLNNLIGFVKNEKIWLNKVNIKGILKFNYKIQTSLQKKFKINN